MSEKFECKHHSPSRIGNWNSSLFNHCDLIYKNEIHHSLLNPDRRFSL